MSKQFECPEMQKFFNSLPPAAQESIVQSNAPVDTIQQLRQLAGHFLGSPAPGSMN